VHQPVSLGPGTWPEPHPESFCRVGPQSERPHLGQRRPPILGSDAGDVGLNVLEKTWSSPSSNAATAGRSNRFERRQQPQAKGQL